MKITDFCCSKNMEGFLNISVYQDGQLINSLKVKNKILFLSRYILARAFNPNAVFVEFNTNGDITPVDPSRTDFLYDKNRFLVEGNLVGLAANMGFLQPNSSSILNRLVIADGSYEPKEKVLEPGTPANPSLWGNTFENDLFGNDIQAENQKASFIADSVEQVNIDGRVGITSYFTVPAASFTSQNGDNIIIRQWGLATQDGYIFSKVISPFIKKNNQELKVSWSLVF